MNNINKKRKKGFTLIELIIVIAIIAILAAIAIPKFATIRHNANVTTDIANAKNIHSVVAQAIANEKLTIPVAGNDVTAAISGYNVSSSLETAATKSKVDKANFYFAVDNDGNITVFAGSASAEKSKDGVTPKNEVYPKQGDDFEKE